MAAVVVFEGGSDCGMFDLKIVIDSEDERSDHPEALWVWVRPYAPDHCVTQPLAAFSSILDLSRDEINRLADVVYFKKQHVRKALPSFDITVEIGHLDDDPVKVWISIVLPDDPMGVYRDIAATLSGEEVEAMRTYLCERRKTYL